MLDIKKFLFSVLMICFLYAAYPQTDQVPDTEIVNNAINRGDCETLFNFVQNPEGKNQALINSANQALRRYTTIDTTVTRYRTNRMEGRIRNVGNELTENVFLDPRTYLPDVVTRLMLNLNDPFLKVKVINDWICDNIAYDVDHYFGRRYNSQDYVSVLRNKKGVCSGYAALFYEMCRLGAVQEVRV
ncbi:MAG: transglutaminase-like domain-containing protein [Treponema sp.]|nr:transglutaminase-like domain-containing protein [Treponema sp.]